MAAPSSVGKPEQWWLGVWEAGVASVVAAVATLRYCGGLSRSSTPKSMTGYSRSLFAVGQPSRHPNSGLHCEKSNTSSLHALAAARLPTPA
jgi:hypothetical protein